MKRILLTTCALISLSLGLSFASVSSLYAATCNGVETSIDYHCDDYQTDSISSLLMFIINFMGIGVGIAVVAGIAWGGLTYARSGGDSGAAKEGMDIIRNAIIGLVLFLGLWSLANFFIPGGAFNLNAETATYNPTSESDGVASMGITHGGDFIAGTYNVRTSSLSTWDSTRANAILAFIKTVDVVGIQEGKSDSIAWLKTKLTAAGYSNAVYGNGGEYRAVFWKNSVFTAVKQGSKNLSDGRNVTWVRLKLKSTDSEFYFLNTHLRLWTTQASGGSTTSYSKYRAKEISEILNFVKSNIGAVPTVFVGDMNSRPNSPEDRCITTGFSGSTANSYNECTYPSGGGFRNAYSVAATKKNTSYNTIIDKYSGGVSGVIQTGQGRIDHIYIKNGAAVSQVEIMIQQRGSDHLPVKAIITLPNP